MLARMGLVSQLPNVCALVDTAEEELAHRAPTLDALTAEECERIARVAYRISQVEALKHRKVVPGSPKPWCEFTPRERVEACATVTRIVQAMCLLGWLEPPVAQ